MAELVTKRLLRPEEVAARLSISRTQAYRLLAREIQSVRIGSLVRVDPEVLEKYIQERTQCPENAATEKVQ
jgi:excisionase family DNA binding protein